METQRLKWHRVRWVFNPAYALAWLILGQAIAPIQIVGALIVVAAVMVLGSRRGKKP